MVLMAAKDYLAERPAEIPGGNGAIGSVTQQNDIQKFTLRNAGGMSVEVSNFGATITAINVPDKEGHFDDVVLGFKNPEDYQTKKHPHFGGIIGRVCNRIAGGKFSLGGKEYILTRNKGEHHQHGGNKGFDKAVWSVESSTGNSVVFTHLSPDGDEGYPGELKVRVTYTLTGNNEIHIEYRTQSDRETPVNLTNHTYFNLKGEGKGTVAGHLIQVNASQYIPVDKAQIPIAIESVDGTPLDLRKLRPLGDGLDKDTHEQLAIIGKGYDHNFIIDAPSDKKLHLAAHVEEPDTGRVLEVETTEPGVQLYTGNSLDGSIRAKDGSSSYARHTGFCLETQHFPDSVNHPEFPPVILKPGEIHTSETVFRFSVQNLAK